MPKVWDHLVGTQKAVRGRRYMAGFRGLLYTLAKLMGDYNAVKKGKVGKRVQRRVAGKATGRAMRKLIK